ncbi:UPF0149 family protein [Alteromonas sp. 009811495]|uniref:UPF0149 family protein n=1 Tax=Alteromonas sp. 009811495 TaxID=3002962 RepID=UPI0031596BA0
MSEEFPIHIISNTIEHPCFKQVLPSVPRVDGMIFAVAAAPEIPMPEQWMPWVITNSASHLIDKDVDKLAETLMDGLRAHLGFMRSDAIPLPAHMFAPEQTDEGVRPTTALADWLNGLLQAHKQVEPVWQSAWEVHAKKNVVNTDDNEAPEVRLSRCLKLFSTLANIDLALQYRNEEQAQQLNNNLALLIKQLPAMLKDYTQLAGELAEALPNQFETFVKPQ